MTIIKIAIKIDPITTRAIANGAAIIATFPITTKLIPNAPIPPITTAGFASSAPPITPAGFASSPLINNLLCFVFMSIC